jgi:ribosomal RNA-processing protein 12
VAAIDPHKFLARLLLEMDGGNLLESRMWRFPILKQRMVGARVQFYQETLVSLATRLRKRARKCVAVGKLEASTNVLNPSGPCCL